MINMSLSEGYFPDKLSGSLIGFDTARYVDILTLINVLGLSAAFGFGCKKLGTLK